jgi:hypothetical protein
LFGKQAALLALEETDACAKECRRYARWHRQDPFLTHFAVTGKRDLGGGGERWRKKRIRRLQ